MPAADRLLAKAGLLWDGPGAAYDARSWPTPVRIAVDEAGRFSSSLNFTAIAVAEAVPPVPALRRRQRPHARPQQLLWGTQW